MTLLGIDIGSSSVKAAIIHGPKNPEKLARVAYPTLFNGPRVEVEPDAILRAVINAIDQLGPTNIRHVDAVALTGMAPSWIAMDARGRPLTNIVTHQDRRSIEIAREIEKRVGKARHLKLCG